MYGAVAYAAHHPRGWEAVPDGAGSSSYLSSASFYGGAIGQPPARPRPPPPPIVLQISSVFFTAALLDFDGRELALDPQEFEDFRALYMDAISRIPELLNLQTYQVPPAPTTLPFRPPGCRPSSQSAFSMCARGRRDRRPSSTA